MPLDLVRRPRRPLVAAAYVGALALAAALVPIGSLARAQSGPQQITDCIEGSSTQSGTLAFAVARGGTWTFACGGTAPVSIDITSTLSEGAGGTLTLLGGGESVTLNDEGAPEIFVVDGGTLTLDGLTLQGGSTSGQSAAILNEDGGRLAVSDSTFSGNEDASSGPGGGAAIFNHLSTLEVSNSTFEDNSAPATSGGAIFNAADSTATVSDSTFSGNSAGSDGGAIENAGTLTVSNSTFTGNSAVTGGAIEADGTATISNSTFSGNTATGEAVLQGGGAIFSGDTLTVSNSTFSENSAGSGGAILNNGGVTVVNSTFSDNSGTSVMGAGGAISNDGAATVENSILALTPAGGNCSGNTLSSASTNNLEFGDAFNTCGSSVVTTGNPELGALADNGGATQTIALGAGSAALGAGDAAVCASAPVGGFDQRGVVRGTTGATCDIGAYQGTAPSASDLAGGYALQRAVIAPPAGLSPGQTASLTVGTETAESRAAAPDVPLYLSLSGGTGTASVGGVSLSATPQLFISDANGDVAVQYTAGSAPAGGAIDTLTVADAPQSPVTLQASAVYDYPQLAFTSAPRSGGVSSPAAATIGPITVAMEVAGSPLAAAAPVTLALQSSSATGVFATALDGTPVTAVTIPSGSTSVSLFYGDSAAGTATVTASAAGAASAAQQETVLGRAPAPTVTGISPSSGPAAGGTVVTISGTSFVAPATVTFGTVPATEITVQSSSQVQATSPAGTGTVDVTVTTPQGTSATGAADRFTYTGTGTSAACAGGGQTAPSFSDVAASYWAYPQIQLLACRGIVDGFPNGSFEPDGSVTRAEFVKMLVLTLGLQPSSEPTPFTDVAATDWFAPYVSAAVQAGIVEGVTPTAFGPDQTITREQMAVLVARGLKLTKTATLHFTDDATIDAWALQGVEETVAAGYINGFPTGAFQPLGTTTRAQAAKVLATVLQG